MVGEHYKTEFSRIRTIPRFDLHQCRAHVQDNVKYWAEKLRIAIRIIVRLLTTSPEESNMRGTVYAHTIRHLAFWESYRLPDPEQGPFSEKFGQRKRVQLGASHLLTVKVHLAGQHSMLLVGIG